MSDARSEALEFKAKGNKAFSAKDYDEAIEWFSKVRARVPGRQG